MIHHGWTATGNGRLLLDALLNSFGWLKGTFYRKRSRNGLTTTHLPFNSGIVQVHHSAHDKWPENMFYTFLYSVWIFLLWGWNTPTHVLKLGTTSTWNYLMGPWGTKPPHKVRSCHLGNRPSNQTRKSRSLLRPRKIDCQMSKPCHFFVAALSFSKAGILCCTPPASFCINEPRASFKGGPAQTPKTGVFFAFFKSHLTSLSVPSKSHLSMML